jgi:hypothetical protein
MALPKTSLALSEKYSYLITSLTNLNCVVMGKVDFTFNIALDEDEFVKVEDHLYTTRETLRREEPKVHLICKGFLETLKDFEGLLTNKIVDEWLLLTRALDQTCSYGSSWDDRKILKELIAGNEHPVGWYVKNCKAA